MSGFVKQASGIFRTVKDACITFVVPGQCLHCGSRFMDSEDVFCTEKCSSDYWTQYRTKKGGLICGYPNCGKPCYVDVSGKLFNFCGRSHADEFKKLAKQMATQSSNCYPKRRKATCGYPDCTKPCHEDDSGQKYLFCGKTHAEKYKKLQAGGNVHDGHQTMTSANQGSRILAVNIQDSTGPIYFYNRNDKYYEFTNFYERSIVVDGLTWSTTEHYFQAQKFVGTPYMAVIQNMQRPRDAFDLSRKPTVSPWLRNDWEKVKCDVMLKALLAKFTQHEDLKRLLLSTGNRHLVEHTSNDSFWGDGGDGSGKNNLGKLLMVVRQALGQQRRCVSIDGDETGDSSGPNLIDFTEDGGSTGSLEHSLRAEDPQCYPDEPNGVNPNQDKIQPSSPLPHDSPPGQMVTGVTLPSASGMPSNVSQNEEERSESQPMETSS